MFVLNHTLFKNAVDKAISMIRDNGLRIGVQGLFQVCRQGFGGFFKFFRQGWVVLSSFFENLLVLFQVLHGDPSGRVLSPLPARHRSSALGTLFLVARHSRFMWRSLAATRANTMPAWSCPASSATASTCTLSSSSPCSRPLTLRPCSIFLRHFSFLLMLRVRCVYVIARFLEKW